jgi:hypothetical protein
MGLRKGAGNVGRAEGCMAWGLRKKGRRRNDVKGIENIGKGG